jgi:hypothetical protein
MPYIAAPRRRPLHDHQKPLATRKIVKDILSKKPECIPVGIRRSHYPLKKGRDVVVTTKNFVSVIAGDYWRCHTFSKR